MVLISKDARTVKYVAPRALRTINSGSAAALLSGDVMLELVVEASENSRNISISCRDRPIYLTEEGAVDVAEESGLHIPQNQAVVSIDLYSKRRFGSVAWGKSFADRSQVIATVTSLFDIVAAYESHKIDCPDLYGGQGLQRSALVSLSGIDTLKVVDDPIVQALPDVYHTSLNTRPYDGCDSERLDCKVLCFKP